MAFAFHDTLREEFVEWFIEACDLRPLTSLTLRMKAWAEGRLDQLARENLCGFVFKSRSPSSGMEQVPVCDDKGIAHAKGSGIFAKAFMERFPHLPV